MVCFILTNNMNYMSNNTSPFPLAIRSIWAITFSYGLSICILIILFSASYLLSYPFFLWPLDLINSIFLIYCMLSWKTCHILPHTRLNINKFKENQCYLSFKVFPKKSKIENNWTERSFPLCNITHDLISFKLHILYNEVYTNKMSSLITVLT